MMTLNAGQTTGDMTGLLELLERRARLHAELVGSRNPDRQWLRDRADEMAYLNRQLVRLGYTPEQAV